MEATIAHFLLVLSRYPVSANGVVFAVAFLESFAFIGLVVPGAAFAVTAGWLASRGVYSLGPLMVSGSAGAVLADVASFYLARHYGEAILRWNVLSRYRSMVDQGRIFFSRHGGKSVFLGRFVGMVRPVVPFLAGLLDMNPATFWVYALSSGILWGVAYIGGGYFFGESWKSVESWLGWIGWLVLAVALLCYLFRSRLVGPGQGEREKQPAWCRFRRFLLRK